MKEYKQIIIALLIMSSFLISMYLYPYMSEQMPTHWNAQGQIDGYMHKFWALFMIPLISSASVLLFYFIPKIDPLKKNIAKFKSHYDGFIVIFTAYMFYIYVLTVIANFKPNLNFTKLMIPAFGVLIFYTGSFLKSAKRNWFIGIRTPWTLSHDKVWEKTHSVGGLLFKLSGIISLFGILFEKYAVLFIMVPIMSVSVFLIVYSFVLYQRVNKEKIKKKKS